MASQCAPDEDVPCVELTLAHVSELEMAAASCALQSEVLSKVMPSLCNVLQNLRQSMVTEMGGVVRLRGLPVKRWRPRQTAQALTAINAFWTTPSLSASHNNSPGARQFGFRVYKQRGGELILLAKPLLV
eukprot:CAMPEP_0202895506 /NCGR_PEP_ID=MMETSP1392-20130828/4686_1 /ASSEMBLY_ACC=CAM_ASM_000868 /TAXON_ID=225041 /ORGANISM="Chlamydomonas chlamydogama, Strain SAG 11-48b" /LENGTH=129 /DNA_ID=CAMNT_0049580531 /DNA_START=132 /DNA_END=521 /DNA_ORIENTATION=-